MYYVCAGNVRGECGHHHRTVESAEACLAQGGYSDRIIEGRTAEGNAVAIDEDGHEE